MMNEFLEDAMKYALGDGPAPQEESEDLKEVHEYFDRHYRADENLHELWMKSQKDENRPPHPPIGFAMANETGQDVVRRVKEALNRDDMDLAVALIRNLWDVAFLLGNLSRVGTTRGNVRYDDFTNEYYAHTINTEGLPF